MGLSIDAKRAQPNLQTEEGKLSFLRQINAGKEGIIQELVETGMSADTIAQMCNEVGELVYSGLDDPNTLPNRFQFIDLENPEVLAPVQQHTTLDIALYPTVANIQYIRGLAGKALEGMNILRSAPTLHTEADYRAYFDSLHPTVLEHIIRNLNHIELTKGCNGRCKDVCAAMVEGTPTLQVPFNIITWLFDEHVRLTSDTSLPELFFANDVADYEYEGKTAVDIYKHIFEKYGVKKSCVVVFSLAPRTIEFLYQFGIVHKGNIGRISRLRAGNIEQENKRLFGKLEERAAKDGRALSDDDRVRINFGLTQGDRTKYKNIKAGNGVNLEEEEKEYLRGIVVSIPGVALRAGKGFEAIIPRPTSRLYPGQRIAIPITSKSKTAIIPITESKAGIMPYTMDHGMILQKTDLLEIKNSNGDIIHKDTFTPTKKLGRQISAMKDTYLSLVNRVHGDPSTSQKPLQVGLKEDLMKEVFEEGINENVSENIMHTYKFMVTTLETLKVCIPLLKQLYEDCGETQWAIADTYLVASSIFHYVKSLYEDLIDILERHFKLLKANPNDPMRSIIEQIVNILRDMALNHSQCLEDLLVKMYNEHKDTIDVMCEKLSENQKKSTSLEEL